MPNHEEAVKIAAEALFEAGVYGQADRCVFVPEKQYDALKLALDKDERWGEGLVSNIIQDIGLLVCSMVVRYRRG